jgi:antitoxin CptB
MPDAVADDNISIIRKKLIFRSWHRGTREIDLLLGRFADAHVPDFSAEQATQYARFLDNSDPDIFNWVARSEPLPPSEDSTVVQMLLAFYPHK